MRLDAVDRDAGRRDVALRVHQLLEAFLPAQLAGDDARRADLDDLVALGRVQAGGLGVEHGAAQLGQRPLVERAARFGLREQVEVVVLGPAVAAHEGLGLQRHLRAGQRQQEAE
jgi:hypothetical protein